MMKNYKLTTVLVLLISAVFTTTFAQNISFQFDMNASVYPEAGKSLWIGGNPGSTGWNPTRLELTDPDADGVYSGTLTDIPEGIFYFRVFQGTTGETGWGAGDWIGDPNSTTTGGICGTQIDGSGNYQYTVNGTTNVTFNFPAFNGCFTETSGVLSNKSFDLVDFSVSPNPAQNSLNITSSEKINSFSIYTLLGSKIVENRKYNEGQSIDVSSLLSGMYIIEVESEGLKSTVKFVKN